MPKWRQILPTKLFTGEIDTDKVATVKVLLLSKHLFIILFSWTVYIIATIVLRETRSWKALIFYNNFSVKISINNRLLMLTSFGQLYSPVDSTRSRCNKIRLNILISSATYIDICARRGNVKKCVNDNIDNFMWAALFNQILFYLFIRSSVNNEACIFIYVPLEFLVD